MHDRTVLTEDRHVFVWDPECVMDLIMEAICIAVEHGGDYAVCAQSFEERSRFMQNVALNMSRYDPCGEAGRPFVSIGTASFLFDSGIKSGEDISIFPTLYIKGVPHLRTKGRGDHLVTVVVKTPDKLTKNQKKLLEELAEA